MATGLATRCTACGTVFRVVPDQLRVSEGWVRCGRCAEVFNASEALLDMETGAVRLTAAPAPTAAPQPLLPGEDFEIDVKPPPAAPAVPEPPASPPPRPAVAVAGAAAPLPAPEPDLFQAPHETLPAVDDKPAGFGPETLLDGPEAHESPAHVAPHMPSFVRRADSAARWRRPGVRAALGVATALGLLLLAAQVLMEYRDLAAARWPATQPALAQACAALGCSVGPARVLDGLAVESSGLVRVERSSLYKLNVALRNRAAIDVALPALELSLTDSQGRLVARRVLRTAELGVTQATLAAGRDVGLQATLQAATEPVAGYTIELFYP